MKLKTTTLVLLICCLGLGTAVFLAERIKTSTQDNLENQQSRENLIFDFAEKEIETLTIETGGKTLKFQQTSDQIQPWKMLEPEQVIASEPSVSFLVNLLVEGKANESFIVTKDQLNDYGLAQPLAKILITVKKENQEGKEAQLFLGKPNFDDTLIYAQVSDSKMEENQAKIVLVSKSFQYAVERDYEDWKEKQEEKNQNTNP
jgi:hypothetical protein